MPQRPKPVFDTLHELIQLQTLAHESNSTQACLSQWLTDSWKTDESIPPYVLVDFQLAISFLYSYRGSKDTFSAYRRDVERLLQWSWLEKKQSILDHRREDIESFVEFCIKPPNSWIGLKNVARFKLKNGTRTPNPEWRPFVAKISKRDVRDGAKPEKKDFSFSQSALKVTFGILSSFYSFLVQEEKMSANPVSLIRQKSKFIRKESTHQTIRRLSDTQWMVVIRYAEKLADDNTSHERTLFILACLYGMYLRISELVSNPRWSPTMGDFFKDDEGNWWFKTVGKGNKLRQIAVSKAMLNALTRYRTHYLSLPPYPAIGESTPLLGHLSNPNKPIRSDRPIRKLVQNCFDFASDTLRLEGKHEEADSLQQATVHWLRHTGISDDVKHRPREHVRDDAGHTSGAITDRYIDVKLRERARTARNKKN